MSKEFADFTERYDFVHVTSSPHYAHSNGQAERTVLTVNGILKEAKDPSMALLAYRSTLFTWCNLSPTELLTGRCLRDNIPITSDQLTPDCKFLKDIRTSNSAFKDRQRRNYDRHHDVRVLPAIAVDSDVWVNSSGVPFQGRVTLTADAPWSYMVDTPTGQVRRNHQNLNVMLEHHQ